MQQEHMQQEHMQQEVMNRILSKFPTERICSILHTSIQHEIQFQIDPRMIEIYFHTYVPMFIQEEKYYLIAMRSWGMGDKMMLYIDEMGETFYIKNSLK